MAIVQISRITQRKGLEEDLPQPLAGAELGWAIDQRRLFIGNGELEEGAPTVGNTEILTEYSDIIAVAASYTYQGSAAGYVVQTGPTTGNPVALSLQAWLDQWATVKDFGAVGDGSTDDTDAINRALYQLYCRQTNTQIRRKLFFPAGTYKVSGTILIPPFATLYGEGPEGSIIDFQVETWASTVAYDAGELVEDSSVYYRALQTVPAGTSLGDTTYWEVTTLPDYVAATVDSLQQSGVDIGTNGATAPQAITVTNMKFSTTALISGVLVEKCSNSSFNNVDVAGPKTETTITAGNDNIRCVDFVSSGSLPCTDVRFNGCKFSGMDYGINVAEQIVGCVFDQCWFDTMYQAVVLGGPVVVDGGPTGTRIVHCLFDNIARQGIQIENCSMNTSGYNAFYDVGNDFFGTGFPSSPVIDIGTAGNECVGDMFERPDTYAYIASRIQLNNTASIAFEGAEKVQLGTYSRATGVKETLLDNVGATPLFTIDATVVRAFKMDYTITRGTGTDKTLTGTLTVVASTDGAGTDLAYNDDFLENTPAGVTLSVSETSSVVTVSYATTAAGYDAYIYYSIVKLA